LPYVLPVSVVFRLWQWMCDKDFGIAQHVVQLFNNGERLSIFRTIPLFMPAVAIVTIWWLIGFNVLLFIAGLRNISSEIYEAAELDGAGRWTQFRRITWPLIWPVTLLVFTIQLILQLKIFDQVYLFAAGGRIDTTTVMVQYILKQAFQIIGADSQQPRRWSSLCSSRCCPCCSFNSCAREATGERFG
jgi:multiple sugar transport system permease protein